MVVQLLRRVLPKVCRSVWADGRVEGGEGGAERLDFVSAADSLRASAAARWVSEHGTAKLAFNGVERLMLVSIAHIVAREK